MEQITLRAETGRETGSAPSRRLRREGGVPAVVYGRGIDPITIAVDRRELYAALTTEAGLNALINLEVGKEQHLAVAREIQRHPVRGEVTHLDFVKISLDEAIEAEVAIEFIGTPIGVREEGGIVDTVNTSVIVNALPMAIPSSIPAMIEDLNIGDTYTVGMLEAVEGVEIVSDPDMPLATIVIPAALLVEEPEAEELEGELAEGEEGEAAEGAEEAADAEASGEGEDEA
ncbi:MAG: 50S ribosomal protein L25 [Actinobacteria bacterium]|nr:50S ribosomal protein L25 [Actinomycetota bacterium]